MAQGISEQTRDEQTRDTNKPVTGYVIPVFLDKAADKQTREKQTRRNKPVTGYVIPVFLDKKPPTTMSLFLALSQQNGNTQAPRRHVERS